MAMTAFGTVPGILKPTLGSSLAVSPFVSIHFFGGA